MSMSMPFEAAPGARDDGIPAADPGPGAPPTAPGYGPEGEEPDQVPADAGGQHAAPPDDPPFRTPDPEEVGPASHD
jgi:hypothetical protein